MHKSTPWLLALLLTTACTRKLAPMVGINLGQYTLNGHTSLVDAQASVEPVKSNSPDKIVIQLGVAPVTPTNGIYLLYYKKPAKPTDQYRLTMMSYSFMLASNTAKTYSAQYDEGVVGTLVQLKGGGYSGTFAGTFTGKYADTHERSMVKGIFTNVFTTK